MHLYLFFMFLRQKKKMRLREVLALLCLTMTCGAQKKKQEVSCWDSKGQEVDRYYVSFLHDTFVFRFDSDSLLSLASVFSGVQQRQDMFQSYPGAGQLEICYRHPSERPAGQKPRLRPTRI